LYRKHAGVIKRQIINFTEFLDSLIRCKELLKKEKVWNIFKNYDDKGIGYLTYDQTISAFKETLGNNVSHINHSIKKNVCRI